VNALRVGMDGADREINEAKYGQAPEGFSYLITGHERIGRVVEVGPTAPSVIQPGAFVVAIVRRPAQSVYDQNRLAGHHHRG
jgi:threonine dehydrogenase-like Zn-dependent dehydrogenase